MEYIRPKIHVVHVIANQPFVPYLNSLVERVHNYPDVKFTVICMYPVMPRLVEDIRNRGCDCYWIKYDKRFRRTWMVYAFFKLLFLFRKLKPDVVHTHLFDDSLVGLMAARMAGVRKRVILKQVTAHNWYFNRSWVWGDLLNNRNATDIIAISEESKRFLLEKEKALPEKIHLVHNGISLHELITQSEEEKRNLINKYNLNGKIVIGTVARYVEWKGHRAIILAAKALVEKRTNLVFLFMGHGGKLEQQKLIDLVRENGLEEYVIFTGFIEPKLMPSVYGIMDICVHAAFMEPFGLVYLEAMANGVPIVTTKTGIAAEIFEDKINCYFINYNDPEGIVNGVEWMLNNPQLKEGMKILNKKIVNEKFSINDTLEKYIKIYKGLPV